MMLKRLITLSLIYTTLSYDYNLLVVELPGSVCSHKACKSSMLGNLSSNNVNFHGLWPNNYDGNHPFYCSDDVY